MKKLLIIIFLFFSITAKSQVFFTADNANAGFTWSIPSTAAGLMGGVTLIASKTSVGGNVLATTDLDFASGVSLATHSPTFATLKFNSGTLGIGVVRLKTDVGYMVAATPLLGLNSTDNNYMMILSGLVRSTGNIGLEFTTASIGASNVSVYVYGVKKQ